MSQNRRSKRSRKQVDFYEPTDGVLNRKRVTLAEINNEATNSDTENSGEEFTVQQPVKKHVPAQQRRKSKSQSPARKKRTKGGALFESLKSKDIALVQVAREWLARFNKSQATATTELLNFGKLQHAVSPPHRTQYLNALGVLKTPC